MSGDLSTNKPNITDGQGLSEQTLAELREIAARYPQARSGLLPMLHLVQSAQGRITGEGIQACAEVLGISDVEVSGVATFYTMYKRRPVGDYHVGVCTNTLCAIMGGDQIYDTVSEHLDVGNDETTEDGKITLERVECNAACDYAPVMMVNWEFMDNMCPGVRRTARRRPACRQGDQLHPGRSPVHLARGRAGPRRLPRRPRRRGTRARAPPRCSDSASPGRRAGRRRRPTPRRPRQARDRHDGGRRMTLSTPLAGARCR